jgi:hypothetical protein
VAEPSATISAVDTVAAMRTVVDAQNARVADAVRDGDSTFLAAIGMSERQIGVLLNPVHPTFAAQYGNAMESAVSRAFAGDPLLAGIVLDARNSAGTIFPTRPPGRGRSLRPDFGVTGGELAGSIVDLTTTGGAERKMTKYHDRVITLEYDRPTF